jgi:BirA family transcriptional regulator, biotin operon repressor / biotin---[acetyl-CoA-carboxylase] ligase
MPTPPPMNRVGRVASTMDVLHAMALEGAPAGTAVLATEQTGGRGSRGRLWLSPAGGLWLSVLLRPARSSGLELLSLRVGLAVSEALSSIGPGRPIRVKWPNDLMLGDLKVGGILCEARWQGDALGWVVVGLGLNVANPVPDALRETVGSLADRVPGRSAAALAEPLAEVIRRIETGASTFTTAELERFGASDWLRGRWLKTPAAGVGDGIAADGALLLRLGDGRQVAVRAGPVELADAPLGA